MSTDTHPLQDDYTACILDALQQAPLIIDRWCSGVCDGLHQRSQSSLQSLEQRRLKAAILALRSHQAEISEVFSAELSKAIAAQSQPSFDIDFIEPHLTVSPRSFDDIQLMGDDQVQDSVVAARVLESVALNSESGLAAFSARFSTAQGFAQVMVENNPLRPKIFANALLLAVRSVKADNGAAQVWLLHGGAVMGQLVQGLYARLNELLIRRRVAPAAYRVITNRESTLPGQTSAFGSLSADESSTFGASTFASSAFAGQAVASSAFGTTNFAASTFSSSAFSSSAFAPSWQDAGALPTIDFSEQQADANTNGARATSRLQSTVRRLRRLFGSSDETAGNRATLADLEPTVHRDFSHTLPEALSALDELQASDAGLDPNADNGVVAAPLALIQLRTKLKSRAKSMGQSLALDVVTLMIEKISGDARLLLSVREVIATFEPAYLRLAVKDPRFFRDQSHPARRLLETITTKSLAYASVTSPGFTEFMQDLLGTAALLTEKQAPDAQLFTDLLLGFDKKTKQRLAASRGSKSLTPDALIQAEQAMVLAKQIAQEIAARPDFADDNGIVTAFLMGSWSRVMAKERLIVHADKTGMHKAIFSLTLGELLWSLNSEKTALNRKRLAKLIPSILERVQGGLLSIDSPLADSKAFFDELLAIHQNALDAGSKLAPPGAHRAKSTQDSHKKRDIDSLFSQGNYPGTGKSRSAPDTEQHFRGPHEISIRPHGGYQGTQPFFDTDTVETPEHDQPAVVLGGTQLHLGAWIELAENDHWVRAQLSWISQFKTLFIFTSADGRTHSMAGPLLEFLLLQGQVKVISQEGMLAGAIESITRSAMRNNARAGEQAEQFSRH